MHELTQRSLVRRFEHGMKSDSASGIRLGFGQADSKPKPGIRVFRNFLDEFRQLDDIRNNFRNHMGITVGRTRRPFVACSGKLDADVGPGDHGRYRRARLQMTARTIAVAL